VQVRSERGGEQMSDSVAGPVLVFAPQPVLTVTVEQRGEEPEGTALAPDPARRCRC
jgi:hypothetical protein